MSDGFANPIVGGGGALIYPSIHSPGFTPGVTGWSINKDGTAELDNLVIRGTTLTGTLSAGNTLIVNQFGWFLYAGNPAGPSPSGNFAKVGGLIQSSGTTITVNPVNVGDIVVLHIISNGSAPPSGVTGGNCNWVPVGNAFTGTVNSGFVAAVYVGTATATGAAVATIAFSGTPSTIRNAAQEFTSSTGQYSFVTQNTLDSAGTNTMPAITTAAGQLYSVFEFDNVASIAGGTSGYTYEIDVNGNALVFNPNCGAGVQQPTLGDSTCAFGIAIVLQAGGTPGNLILAGANANGTDGVGNPFVEGLNVAQGIISGTTLMAGNTVKIDSTGLSIYNGSPIPANLQLTVTPGGGIITKAPVIFEQSGSTPTADPNGGATVFSVNGDLSVTDGTDQAAYQTQRRSIVAQGAQSVTSTSFGSVLHSPIGAPGNTLRVYRIDANIIINPNQTGGKAGLRWTGPVGVTGFLDFIYLSASTMNNSGALGNGGSTGGAVAMTMVLGQQIEVLVTGSISVPAGTSGTFTIDAACGTAGDTFSVGAFSSLDVMPV